MVLGAGNTMKYPYTVTGKLALFPYRWHWKNGRFVRFLGFTLLGIFPLFVKIHKAVHSPGNVWQWEEIRRKREQFMHQWRISKPNPAKWWENQELKTCMHETRTLTQSTDMLC